MAAGELWQLENYGSLFVCMKHKLSLYISQTNFHGGHKQQGKWILCVQWGSMCM